MTLHSVHLSPEELAAIDHGLMSVYGTSNQGNLKQNEKENMLFNTPVAPTSIPNTRSTNNYGYNTPTPTPMIFNDGKGQQGLYNTNFNNVNYNQTPGNIQQNSQPTSINYQHQQTPVNNQQKSMNYQQTTPFQTPTPVGIDENLVKSYEDRIEGILRQEREKYEAMESNYRQQLEHLKKNEFGYSEKLKLEQIIQDLRRQIDNLEQQLKEARRNQKPTTTNNNQTDSDKIEALKLHYDRKIANLVGQFEQEKASALEIMKTRAKAEINLIIPKLKSQLQSNLERSQSEIVNKIKGQAQTYIQKMKQDFQMERQVLIEHMRRKHFEEIKQMKQQSQIQYEMKLNEERQKLQKNRGSDYYGYNSGGYSCTSGGYNNTGNSYNSAGNSYNSAGNTRNSGAYSLFGDEPSFLL